MKLRKLLYAKSLSYASAIFIPSRFGCPYYLFRVSLVEGKHRAFVSSVVVAKSAVEVAAAIMALISDEILVLVLVVSK